MLMSHRKHSYERRVYEWVEKKAYILGFVSYIFISLRKEELGNQRVIYE